jgi:hypothetical protein
VHVSHSAFAKFGVRPALTFGLGVEPDHGGDYYPGISFLLGDKAALTLGAAVGQVNTLPAGRQLNDQVTDANTLATLGHRRIGTWFAGISYQFLGGGADDFKKPFQGQGGAGAASGGNGGGGAAPPATTPAPPTVQITSGDKQTLGKSATSQPLEIASNAKGAVVTWALDPKLNFIDIGQHSDHTDANSGKATAVLTTAAGVADTTMRVRATVCDAQANCNNATYFTVKIRP